jgi:hypothetical protein
LPVARWIGDIISAGSSIEVLGSDSVTDFLKVPEHLISLLF